MLFRSEIAKEADFFSFGTNDLTQMTFGFSRDDAAKFLPAFCRIWVQCTYYTNPLIHLLHHTAL